VAAVSLGGVSEVSASAIASSTSTGVLTTGYVVPSSNTTTVVCCSGEPPWTRAIVATLTKTSPAGPPSISMNFTVRF